MSDKQPLPTGTQLSALDPNFRERPHEYLDRLPAEEPVHRDTELGRLFLTRFEDVRSFLSNRSLSVDPRKAPPGSFFAASWRRTNRSQHTSRRCSNSTTPIISVSADWCRRRSTSARWTPFARAFAPLPMAFSML